MTETRRPAARDSAGGTAASSTGSAARLSEKWQKIIFHETKKVRACLVRVSDSHTNFDASFTFHHLIADSAAVMVFYIHNK